MRILARLVSLSLPLVLILLHAGRGVLAEDRSGGTDSGAETERLRERVAELEEQNAAILRQMAEIQERLGLLARPSVNSEPQPSAASLAGLLNPNQETIADRQPGVATVATAGAPAVPPAVPSAPASPALPPPLAAAPAQAGSAQAPPLALHTEGNRSAISFYGFVRVDAIFDDSRPSAAQTPTAIRSEAPGAENRSNFTLHPRLTRFGVNYGGPSPLDTMAGGRISGKLEFDFQNGGRESRAVPRYRHAYLQLGWQDSSLLVGQTWDIISPLYPTVNADTLMWNAGNLGDRRAQIRYTYEPGNGLSLRTGLGLTGAVDSQDADGNGIRDGEASTLPNFQGRVGYSAPGGRASLGFWSHYGQMQTDAPFGGKTDFDSYSYGGDYDFRFNSWASLKGELWAGSGLGDFRGGIGQTFHLATGREIDSRGGWVELGLRAGRYSFSTGFTSDDPKNGHVPSGGATENRAWYVTNQFRLAPPVTFGIDYLYWKTAYKGLPDGTDNRFNLYFIYGF